MKAEAQTELTVFTRNLPGELARALETASRAGINLLAFCCYDTSANDGVVLLVPQDPEKARQVFATAGFRLTVNPVVLVEAEAGAGVGAALARKIAQAGINISYAYASTVAAGKALAVFRVSDVAGAVRAINA
jgi:hypothetical protein